jgi:NAD(P)-dependent dehydrogenase (short-subunit alcohol dehydrogenase family)
MNKKAAQAANERGENMALLNDKRCLLFDAGDGLGAALADTLRAEGARVWRAGNGGDGAFTGTAAEVDGSFAAARAALGGLDLVVGPAPQLEAILPGDWQVQDFETQVARHGALTAAIGRAALNGLAAPGAVCFLGSIWALATSPDAGLSGAALAALGPLTKSLALAGVSRGVRVNSAYLGLVDTPAMRAWCVQRGKVANVAGDIFERTVAKVPLGRAGTPQEVARSVAFLLSEHARSINGASVMVDGGLLYA